VARAHAPPDFRLLRNSTNLLRKFWTRTVLAKDSENQEGHKRALMGHSDTPTAHPALLRAILKQAHSKQGNGGSTFGA
jgi:hypothetical protein